MWISENSHQIIWKLLQFSKQVLISSSSFLSYLKSFAIFFPLSCGMKIHSRRKLSTSSFGGGWASNLYTIFPFCSSSSSSFSLRQQEIAQIENENGKFSSFPLQSSLILSSLPLPPQKRISITMRKLAIPLQTSTTTRTTSSQLFQTC